VRIAFTSRRICDSDITAVWKFTFPLLLDDAMPELLDELPPDEALMPLIASL
jgi:hypothetical protein